MKEYTAVTRTLAIAPLVSNVACVQRHQYITYCIQALVPTHNVADTSY